MKQFFIFLFLLILTNANIAQTGTWDWAKNVAGADWYGSIKQTSVDRFGNLFVLSTSTGSNATPSIVMDSGSFIARYNNSGILQWAKKVDGFPNTIANDASGNIYVGGTKYLYSSGANSLSTTGAYITKLDANGNLVWDKNFSTKYSAIEAMTVSPSGKIFVTGATRDTLVMGSFTLTSRHWLFISRISSNGNVDWAKTGDVIGDTSTQTTKMGGTQIALDQFENVYVPYFLSGNCPYCSSGWLVKLDQNGSFMMNKQYGSYASSCHGLVIDANGDIIMSNDENVWTSGGETKLKKFTATLNSVYWSTMVGSWQCTDLALNTKPLLDQSGSIYISGNAGAQCWAPWPYTLVFGSDTVRTDSLADIIIARVNKQTGAFQNAWHIHGRLHDDVSDICMDKFGNCYLGGAYNIDYQGNYQSADTLCFDNNCISYGNVKNLTFLAKLRFSNQQFTDNVAVKESQISAFKVYPNPVSDLLTIENNDRAGIFDFHIYDIQGILVFSTTVEEISTIDVTFLTAGIYVLEFHDGESTHRQKLVRD